MAGGMTTGRRTRGGVAWAAAALMVAGCGADPVLFATPSTLTAAPGADPGGRIGVAYRSIEVRQASLPTYAEGETIYLEGAGGTLVPAEDAEWADAPSRAITLDLASVLGAVTGARVAAEPWPYDGEAQGRVEVRFTRLAAGADGRFRVSGQYHVADLRVDELTDEEIDAGKSPRPPSDRSGRFEVAVPYDPAGGATAIAEARSRAVRDLAREIASRGM